MKRSMILILLVISLAACVPGAPIPTSTPLASATPTIILTPTITPTLTSIPTATPKPLIPNFDHIVVIIFENKEFGSVIGNSDMPVFNQLAEDHTLLSQFYAVTHPSLPNYIAIIGGDTFGIETNCQDCFLSAMSLPDLIEQSGRTWKTYQEDMPEPCYIGSTLDYAPKHNPFVYFDAIRLDTARCERSVVPLTDLQTDIQSGTLPNFIFITPNLCNSSHDCSLDVSDQWLETTLNPLIPALEADGSNYLIVLTWDEGQGDHSCCGLPEQAGGRIAVVLISPLVKEHFEDSTPYSHYSLLKTISNSWGLQYLGHASQDDNALILTPWK